MDSAKDVGRDLLARQAFYIVNSANQLSINITHNELVNVRMRVLTNFGGYLIFCTLNSKPYAFCKSCYGHIYTICLCEECGDWLRRFLLVDIVAAARWQEITREKYDCY